MRLERLDDGGVSLTLTRLDVSGKITGTITLLIVREETIDKEYFLKLESDSERGGKDYRFIAEEDLADNLFDLFIKD